SGNRALVNGGGLYSNGTLDLEYSTLSGNSAAFYGGGAHNDGIARFLQSTVSGNSAELGGGGIYNNDDLAVVHGTLSENAAATGGGLSNAATATFEASAIANSTGGDCVLAGGTLHATDSLIEAGLGCVNGIDEANRSGDPA